MNVRQRTWTSSVPRAPVMAPVPMATMPITSQAQPEPRHFPPFRLRGGMALRMLWAGRGRTNKHGGCS